MSVSNFYCFLWVKIRWDKKPNHFFLFSCIYVCFCVSVSVQTYTKYLCTYNLIFMTLFAKIVVEEDTSFFSIIDCGFGE